MFRKKDADRAYDYGAKGEEGLYDIIKKYYPDAISTDRYNHFDFIILKDNKIILIELKTRTCSKDKYNTTYFPVSKIKYYRLFKKDYPDNKCFLLTCFGFPDEDNIIKYYATQYKPIIFNSYDTTDHPWDINDGNINIPISDLLPIEVYFKPHGS